MSFVFSVVATGLSYARVSLAFLLCSIVVPSQSLFYKLQRKLLPIFENQANESMKKCRDMMKPNTTITVDGAWDHKRNGNYCTVFFIDSQQDKIIHSELVSKRRARVNGNYTGSSNGMESAGVERGIKFLKSNGVVASSYCHDKDNKTRKLFSDNWPELQELLDKNHTKKAIVRRFTKHNEKQCLHGLKERVVAFFYYLLKNFRDIKDIKNYWTNIPNHFSGDHSKCPNHKKTSYIWKKKDNKFSISKLNQFTVDTLPLFDKVSLSSSTQSNESSNALRAKYTDKDKAWKTSYPVRVCASILQKNEPYKWMFPIMKLLGIPLPQGEAKSRIDALIEQQNKRILHQKTQNYQNLRKKQRHVKRLSNKSTKSKNEYKGAAKSEEPLMKQSPVIVRKRKANLK